ncbi:TniB family NTP-binding protein [Cupriavidus sp. M-11]|uniref:TniB family NTP-binding protein n=1 Tax=Cupriavidus sp. M-11 TaxID=3233038 RepID=UPI003F9108F5
MGTRGTRRTSIRKSSDDDSPRTVQSELVGIELAPQTIEERVIEFRRRLIRYPAFSNAMRSIERCHFLGRHMLEEPDCLLITGVSGAGKSTVRKEYSARFPREETDDRTVIPVLGLELPSAPTVKNVAERILMAMGDPYAEKGSAESKTARIITLFRECRVELAMLDEFQQFVDNSGGKIEYKVADWLKQLINATRVPFVLLGLPRCTRILELNEQLRRRFLPRLALAPFSVKTKAESMKFAGVLKTLDERLPFSVPSAIIEPSVVELMFCASNGLIDYLMKLVSEALRIALCGERETVDIDTLRQAFQSGIWADADPERNPFSPEFIRRPLNKAGEPFYGYS